MSDDLFRVYRLDDGDPFGRDGYPLAWHGLGDGDTFAIKSLVRERAGNRCLRCGHPYAKGDGEWSTCDDRCTHAGPIRYRFDDEAWCDFGGVARLAWTSPVAGNLRNAEVEARWRILTVHHLNGIKADCRWWNLVPLCQRDHLLIQRRVVMDRPWPWQHTGWFKPYAAAFYAHKYVGVDDPTREEVEARMDEFLAVGMDRERIERMPV